ncbi:hypothetical protein EUX98_g2434 [Antrodiella citrinella]|uniref:Translation machinery associated TMA7 n=1 Tax=Antrodiella citrinella TaxID=2447956 RepID=A0A4S4MZ01_9APHY|nr:hypothetical protein EUX98_g2434 [Antrodiella citrinella]
MSSRQGGKLKPLKAPKKDKKDLDDEDAAFAAKKKADEAAVKAAREKALKGGAPGGGIKKYVIKLPYDVFLCLPLIRIPHRSGKK